MADIEKELLTNIAPFGLRMQADLKDRVRRRAEANNRSMNAEIISLIEAALIDATFRESEDFLPGLEKSHKESKAIRAQAEAIEFQSKVLEKQSKVIELLSEKLDRLLALEDHFRMTSERSAAKASEIREQLSDTLKDHEDEQ